MTSLGGCGLTALHAASAQRCFRCVRAMSKVPIVFRIICLCVWLLRRRQDNYVRAAESTIFFAASSPRPIRPLRCSRTLKRRQV
jgi:hypothetical protein